MLGNTRMTENNVVPLSAPGSTSTNGNGDLTRHRLGELERRMTALDDKVDDISKTCVRIETALKNVADKTSVAQIETTLKDVATKTYVLQAFAITIGLFLLTIVGHVAVRAWGP